MQLFMCRVAILIHWRYKQRCETKRSTDKLFNVVCYNCFIPKYFLTAQIYVHKVINVFICMYNRYK